MTNTTLQPEDIKAAAPSAEMMYADYQGLRSGNVDAVMQSLLRRQKRQRITMWVFVAYYSFWGLARLLLTQHFEREVSAWELLHMAALLLFSALFAASTRSVTRDLRALERLRDEHTLRDEATRATG